MNLSQNTWFVRYFFWCCKILDRFIWIRYYNRYDQYQSGTNLCHFFRTMMWGSLVLFLNCCVYFLGFFDIFVYPFIVFGANNYAFAILSGAAVAVLAVAIVYGISWISDCMQRVRETKKPKTKNLSGLFVWYMAVKNHFCPTISFQTGDQIDE